LTCVPTDGEAAVVEVLDRAFLAQVGMTFSEFGAHVGQMDSEAIQNTDWPGNTASLFMAGAIALRFGVPVVCSRISRGTS
jgi:hypothetical protein